MIRIIIPFILSSLCWHIGLSQFNGGDGDHVDKTALYQQSLTGQVLGVEPMYRGGAADGFTKNQIMVSIDGSSLETLFSGGNGDGTDKEIVSISIDGSKLEFFAGGRGDGHTKESINGFINGSLLEIYGGADGDGFDKSQHYGFVTGEPMNVFFGGDGDGVDKAMANYLIDGSDLSALFRGGLGDGHSKNKIGLIFTSSECTFVINTDDAGFGSLRYAIGCAQVGDTIHFSPAIFNQVITLTSDKLDIGKSLIIESDVSDNILINANSVSKGFDIGSNVQVEISGLSIIVGNDFGSGISNRGMTTLVNMRLINSNPNLTPMIHNLGTITVKGFLRLE